MQHSAQVRQFIQRYFDDNELTVICYDYFRAVSDEFTDGMTRSTKIQLLLSYCDKYGHFPHLFTILEKQRPIPYAADLAPLITTAIAPPLPSTARPTRNPHQIFISYAHQDATMAQRLAHDLQQAGWPIWIAPDSITPGELWAAAIDRGLESSGIFLLLISPAAVNSRWVQDETYAAIDLEKKGHIRFFSLLLTKTPPYLPPTWKAYQYIPLAPNYQTGFTALQHQLQGQPPSQLDNPTWGGLTWIEIPAGPFWMGSDDGLDREKPRHHLHLSTYWISQTPLTNAQYYQFVQATGYEAPQHWPSTRLATIPQEKANHPVVYISWFDALAYCDWLSQQTGQTITLPSEAEWEKAARGPEGLIYPWGNTFEAKHCHTWEGGARDTTPVDQYPQGASFYGVLDMSGNVWEWTRTIYEPYPYQANDGRENLADKEALRVLRGGSWDDGHYSARAAYRHYIHPNLRYGNVGCRFLRRRAPV